jgi:hypothetical protein
MRMSRPGGSGDGCPARGVVLACIRGEAAQQEAPLAGEIDEVDGGVPLRRPVPAVGLGEEARWWHHEILPVLEEVRVREAEQLARNRVAHKPARRNALTCRCVADLSMDAFKRNRINSLIN